MGDRVAVSIAYSDLGHCALKIKDYSRAAANCIQGLRLATELRHPYAIAHNLAEFGLLALAEGKIEQAVRYFAASEATHATHLSDIRLTIHRDIQEALDALKARLGESGFQEAWMAGKVWTVKEACAAAMNDYII